MAQTEWAANHPLAVKLWSKKLYYTILKQTYVNKFMSTDGNNIITVLDELSKGAGDKVTFGLRGQLTFPGIAGDATLEGNEESLNAYADALFIDQLRHGVRSAGKMSEKRVSFSFREQARMALADWFADRWDVWFFNQLAGNVFVNDVRYTGMNAVTAPTNVVYAGGAADEDAVQAEPDATFSVDLFEVMIERAKTSNTIRPIRVNGENKYVVFINEFATTALRKSGSVWFDIEKAALQGGAGAKSPIYTGALGEHGGAILHETSRLPKGIASGGTQLANTYRAILAGANAVTMALGKNYGADQKFDWVEEVFDYKNETGISAGVIGGLKKNTFNSQDYGVIVGSYYGSPATTTAP